MTTHKVSRGFEMRFMKETEWDEVLYLIPKGVELYDGDIYYIDHGDGKPFREYYGRYSPTNFDLYQTDYTWEETIQFYKEVDERMMKHIEEQKKVDKFEKLVDRIQNALNS